MSDEQPRCDKCGTTEWDTYSPAYDFGGRYDGRKTLVHSCPRTGSRIFARVGRDPGERFKDGDTFNYLNRPCVPAGEDDLEKAVDEMQEGE